MTGAEEQSKEPHEEIVLHEEIKTEEEEHERQVDEQTGQEVPAVEQEEQQHQAAPVHQGQPEI